MSENSPEGSHVIAIYYRTLSWAVTEVVRKLTIEQIAKLKVPSGEHLAAILTTSFLFTAPTSIDSTGEPDLVFDLADSCAEDLGLGGTSFADFEVKSLPGKYRKYEASINRSLEAGRKPEVFQTTVTSVNTVLREEGRSMIAKAKEQLDKKSKPGHSKNIFLIAHFLDYPTKECYESVAIAHLLEPLSDIEGIDSVWVLWAPTHLVVWSTQHQKWTNLLFGGANPGDVGPSHDQEFDLLQQIELEFLEQTNNPKGSPYVFGLTTGSEDQNDD